MAWVSIVNGETGLSVSQKLDTAFDALETDVADLKTNKAPLAVEVLNSYCPAPSQEPTGLGVAMDILFGQAVNNQYIFLDTDGSMRFKQSGRYHFLPKLAIGRLGSVGTSFLFVRMTINGVQEGVSCSFKLSSEDTVLPWNCPYEIDLSVDDVVQFQLIRDSTGHNSGGLYNYQSADGWNGSSCAAIVVTKKE
jgi:hypothetical protein